MGTASDAAKFLMALMPQEGETSVLFNDNETLNEMLQVSYSFREGFPRFSHGFMEFFGSVRALGHGGNTVAFSALFTIAPEERLVLVVLTNQAGETAICYGLTKALFGEFEPPVSLEEFPDANELGGLFVMARAPRSGFTNLFTSLSAFPFIPVDENTLDLAGAQFVQISPYVFKNMGGGPAFMDIFDYVFIERENGTVIRASIVYFDFVPTGAGSLIVKFGSALLLFLCVIYMIVAVIISIIGGIKNKKKGIPSNLIKKLNITLFSSMAFVIINNIILAGRAFSFAPYSSLSIHFIINIAYAVFVPVCIGFLLISGKKKPISLSTKSKVFHVFTMVFSLILAVILIGWEFWR